MIKIYEILKEEHRVSIKILQALDMYSLDEFIIAMKKILLFKKLKRVLNNFLYPYNLSAKKFYYSKSALSPKERRKIAIGKTRCSH